MTADFNQGARPRPIPHQADTMTYLSTTTTTAAATGAAIVLPTAYVADKWRRDHCDRLLFVLSRAELRAAWATIASTTPQRELGSWGRADEVARHDAAVLTQSHVGSPAVEAQRTAAAARVHLVGTPTWWAGARVDAGTPCPLRPPTAPAHRWCEMDPVCIYCTVVIGTPAPLDRAVLADQVWQSVMRSYGLSRDQVAGAVDALGDLIDARRALATPARRRRVAAVRPEPAAPRVAVARGCRHRFTGRDPVCQHCGQVVGEVVAVTAREVASGVWSQVGRGYGLRIDQVEAAMHPLRDLVNVHRGAHLPAVPTGTAPTAVEHSETR